MRHYLIIILIILIIGIISCEPEQVVEVSWEKYNKIGEMPINRSEHSMAYVGNGRLIMFGGYNNNDEYLKDTWEYDLATHTWTEYNTEAIMPQARNKHAMAYVGNGRLIMFGGYNEDDKYLKDTWEYDLATHTWTEYNTEAIMPQARNKHAMACVGNGQLIMFGGEGVSDDGEHSYLSDTWKYDIVGHIWTECDIETIPFARSEHEMAYVGDGKIIMFGGDIEDIGISSDTWIYDANNHTWTLQITENTPSKRVNHSMVYIGDNKLVMFGGYGSYSGAHCISDTWEYDVDSNNWTECSVTSKIPDMRCSHSMAYAGNGKLIMFGGYDSNKKRLSDTWECYAGSLTDKMTYEKDVPIMYVNKYSITYKDILLGDTSQESFSISNYGTASFDWSVSAGNSYINFDFIDGSVSASPVIVTITADTSALAIGKYHETITITSDTDEIKGSPKTIDVIFNVGSVWKEVDNVDAIPSERFGHSTAYAGDDKLVMFGGFGKNGLEGVSSLADTWEYDYITRKWTKQACETSPESRYSHSMTYAGDGKIVMFGGYDGNNILSDTWIYDVSNHTWTEYNIIDDKATLRQNHSMSYIGDGKVIMFGGKNLSNNLDDTWIYDVSNHTWTKCNTEGHLPSRRHDHSAAYVGNGKLVMFGGLDYENTELNDTWIYDTSNHTWQEVTSDETNPEPTYAHSMSYIGSGKVIMFDNLVNEAWMFDASNNANIWKKYDIPQHIDLPTKRTYQSMSYIGNSKIIMFGGYSADGTRLNNMWEYYGGNLDNEMNY